MGDRAAGDERDRPSTFETHFEGRERRCGDHCQGEEATDDLGSDSCQYTDRESSDCPERTAYQPSDGRACAHAENASILEAHFGLS